MLLNMTTSNSWEDRKALPKEGDVTVEDGDVFTLDRDRWLNSLTFLGEARFVGDGYRLYVEHDLSAAGEA